MIGTPLVLGIPEKEKLKHLKEKSEANPINIRLAMEKIKTSHGLKIHMDQMKQLTVDIPMDFVVTYSVEDGQPIGRCRHMSVSVNKPGRVPNEHAVWMIAQELGFWGSSPYACNHVYLENNQAINLIQVYDQPSLQ